MSAGRQLPNSELGTLNLAGYRDPIALVGGTPQTITLPQNGAGNFPSHVLFSSPGNVFYVQEGSTPTLAVPTATTANGAGPDVNPVMRSLTPTDYTTFQIISAATCIVIVQYFWGSLGKKS